MNRESVVTIVAAQATSFELSPQQRRCVDLFNRGAGPLRSHIEVRLCGALTSEGVKRNLDAAASRFDVLRARLVDDGDGKVAEIGLDGRVQYRFVDLSDHAQGGMPECRLEAIRSGIYLALEANFFDVPLIAHFIRLDVNDHLLWLTQPAWIADATSIGLLTAVILGVDVDDDGIQYPDLCGWLGEAIRDEAAADERAIRQRQLDGCEYAIRPLPSSGHRRAPGVLVVDKLLAECDSATLADRNLLLACYAVLSARRSGSPRVAIGCHVTGRSYGELEYVIGPIAKQMPIEISLDEGLTFEDIVSTIAAARDDAQLSAEFFDWNASASLARGGFKYGFCFHDLPQLAPNSARVSASEWFFTDWSECNSITLVANHHAGSTRLAFVYDQDAYNKGAVEIAAQQLASLLMQAGANRGLRIADATIVSDEHYRHLMRWANWQSGKPTHISLVDLIDAAGSRASSELAIENVNQSLTHEQLNTLTNQVANFLRKEGVTPGGRVGICLRRSVEMIVSIVGVLKAGASYVPIDPGYPQGRICTLMDQAGLQLVVTTSELVGKVSDSAVEVAIVEWDRDLDYIEQCSVDRPATVIHAEQEAYMIFTSGSTGVPKGVSVSHRALISYIEAIENRLDINVGASLTALSTAAADLGYTALYGALGTGRTLRIIDEEKDLDAEALAGELAEHPVDCLKIVPSHMAALLSVKDPSRLLPRKALIFGGDRLPPELIRSVRAIAPALRIINHYGPTETTVGVIAGDVDVAALGSHRSVPLGRPLLNSQCYVLDETLAPVGIGVEGELYLAGDNLATAYDAEPALTASAFLPNPFAASGGRRMYYSGDRAKFNETGQLEFCGRMDEQRKLRGYRIELGEIEAAILAFEGIGSAVVMLREDGGPARLVAYVADAGAGRRKNLVARLRERLPDYMLPAQWVWLKRMPLTANGKIDHAALPAPRRERHAGDNGKHSRIEDDLLALLGELLAADDLSVHDNYFTVGGDSIIAIQLVARARQLGYRLNPRQIFEHPTVRELASLAQPQLTSRHVDQSMVTGRCVLSPIQARFFDRIEIDPQQYNQADLFDAGRPFSLDHLKQAAGRLLEHHDALRGVFIAARSGSREQHYLPLAQDMVDAACEMTSMSVTGSDDAVRELETVVRAAHAGFALDRAPLIRFVGVEARDGDSCRLLIVVHHLLVDAYSWRIIQEDMSTLLGDALDGETTVLPDKTCSYRVWTERICEWAAAREFAAEADYWRTQSNMKTCALPLQGQSRNVVSDARNRMLLLDRQTSNALAGDIHEAFNTNVADVVLCGLAMAFRDWTGHESLPLVLEAHGRDNDAVDLDVSRTVGWFTSMYPLQIELNGLTAVTEIVKSVKEQIRRVPADGLGFGVLRYLQSANDFVNEEPQVCFNYLGKMTAGGDKSKLLSRSVHSDVAQLATRSDRQNRLFQLEIVGMETEEGMAFNFVFNAADIEDIQVERFMHGFECHIKALVAGCLSSAGEFTPTDLVDIDLSQHELDELINSKLAGMF